MKSFPGKRKQPREPAIDVVLNVLEKAHQLRPNAVFITSLLQQYRERGGLSKKQLEGLHSKASKIPEISAANLATLQAIILKKTTRHSTELSEQKNEPASDEELPMIAAILDKYPDHKQVIIFKNKKEARQQLSPAEKESLKRFYKLLIKS